MRDQQLELFATCGIGPLDSPCHQKEPTEAQWKWSGFPKNFTIHKWCAKFFVGVLLSNGRVKGCDCECHGSRRMAVIREAEALAGGKIERAGANPSD